MSDKYIYDKEKGVYFDENGFEYAIEEKEYKGPPIVLRLLIAISTVAILWSIATNITKEQVLFANVNGSSMDYSLLDGQHVMIDLKNKPSLERESIIAFDATKEDPINPRIAEAIELGNTISYVKRIVALPGETIEGRSDGIYINGELLPEQYLANKYRPIENPWTLSSLSEGQLWNDGKEHTVVPEDHVFVLGDNRDISEDSRHFGFVHIDSIIGEVKTLPWNEGPIIKDTAE